MKAIKIIMNKRGQKMAYYYSRRAMRWIRLPLAEAELLISTQQANQVPADALFG